MNQSRYRVLGWLAPSLCMALSLVVFFSQAGRLRAASVHRQQASILLQRALADRAAATTSARKHVPSTTVASPDEETRFLAELRNRAAASGTQILKWTSSAKPAGPTPDPDKADPVLRDVTAIQCELTLGGGFPQLCAFLRELQGAQRLYTLSNVTWNRSKEHVTTLSCVLSRYTTPTAPAAAPAATPPVSGTTQS